MDELQKTLYAHWILDECNSPVEEIEWLVNCILSKNRDRFKKDIQWVLEHIEKQAKEDEKV